VKDYLTIMEKTYGQDASGQARQAWRNIQLNIRGGSLDIATWREFQQQFELAGSRVDDKGEKEEFDLLYKQLPVFWQEKVIRDAQRRPEYKHWVKFHNIPEVTKECIEDLMEAQALSVKQVRETPGGFNIHCKNESDEDKLVGLTGDRLGGHTVKVTRTRVQMDAGDIFKIVGDHLRANDEAESLRISLGGTRRVSLVEGNHSSNQQRNSPRQRSHSPASSSPAPAPTPKVVLEYHPAPKTVIAPVSPPVHVPPSCLSPILSHLTQTGTLSL
jgi:hypothetical protein